MGTVDGEISDDEMDKTLRKKTEENSAKILAALGGTVRRKSD